jgi:hypothetical protein
MASDTLSYNLVAWLLPYPWLKFFSDVRSPLGKLKDGTKIPYAKFSSMGNGATFTIETLIFAAACDAVGASEYTVYGDDIILSSDRSHDLLQLLRFMGFMPNWDKSYLEGPFRESCGGNYYLGDDITPVYLRFDPAKKPELCHVVNGLAGIALPGGKLEDILHNLVKAQELPLVPYNLDSMSGVWIPVPDAYRIGVLGRRRNKRFVDLQTVGFKAYVAQTTTARVESELTYFLWHLRRRGRIVEDAAVVPAVSHKYRRRWVPYHVVRAGTPVHLYGWADRITRES